MAYLILSKASTTMCRRVLNMKSLLSGFEAKKFGKSLERTKLEDFENIIRKAIRLKIYQNELLRSLLKASTLPFTHYYFYGDPNDKYKLFNPKGFEYMVDEIETVRKEIKNS